MAEFQQLPLFDAEPEELARPPAEPAARGVPNPETSLDEATEVYLVALRMGGASPHTVRAFKSDLNLLGQWAGRRAAIGEFSTERLHKFLHWMLTERDKPCSPKTYARRVTTLKNFFGYLHEQGSIPRDPSTALIQQPVSSPLPDILLDDEVEQVLAAARALRRDREKSDARPELLVTLLLQTGIKKSECMALSQQHVNRTNPDAPFIWVRYNNPRMRYKERKIAVEPSWLDVLDEYLAQRQPVEVIFDCTARNLEYVLSDVAKAAGVPPRKMSFETLRWTCAYRDYRDGMDSEKLRQKLGLSRISWRETSSRLEELARQLAGGPLASADTGES